MTRQIISTDKAPAAVGPYSQAVTRDGLVYTAGQIGLDPQTGKLVEGGIQAQARQALTNLQAILEAAGTSLGHVLKTTVFLQDIWNTRWAETGTAAPPASLVAGQVLQMVL
jgi:2-iminobutanoate/2-iminopropanoate deaminase